MAEHAAEGAGDTFFICHALGVSWLIYVSAMVVLADYAIVTWDNDMFKTAHVVSAVAMFAGLAIADLERLFVGVEYVSNLSFALLFVDTISRALRHDNSTSLVDLVAFAGAYAIQDARSRVLMFCEVTHMLCEMGQCIGG